MDLWTIGHGKAPAATFTRLLKKAGITLLVDVRTKPYSRWNPQFNRDNLDGLLSMEGITYLYKGRNLGGLGPNMHYAETVLEVSELARQQRTALMCSESSPSGCHRKTLLTPSFQEQGFTIIHLQHDGTSAAEPTPTPTLF